MKIVFYNLYSFRWKRKINKTLKIASDYLKLPDDIKVNISFVDDGIIRKLNNDFRKIDKSTDVLSFPMVNDISKIQDETPEPSSNLILLGDIIICKEIAKLQAKNLNHTLLNEVVFLALHSFLHLCGYDHINKEDEKEMIELQKTIKTKAGI